MVKLDCEGRWSHDLLPPKRIVAQEVVFNWDFFNLSSFYPTTSVAQPINSQLIN